MGDKQDHNLQYKPEVEKDSPSSNGSYAGLIETIM
jgi:hypothetical protein